MAQAKDKQTFIGRNVSVPSLSSDDANVNTKDNDGSKCLKMQQDCTRRIKSCML